MMKSIDLKPYSSIRDMFIDFKQAHITDGKILITQYVSSGEKEDIVRILRPLSNLIDDLNEVIKELENEGSSIYSNT